MTRACPYLAAFFPILSLSWACDSQQSGYDPGSQQPGDECLDYADCAAGSACIGGVCHVPCIFDSECDTASERCDAGICVSRSDESCGDGSIVGEEACDDGDASSGDGCDADCAIEPGYVCSGEPSVCTLPCPNGQIDAGETCDDADADDGDGCSADCQTEPGWVCVGDPSICVFTCGNGYVDAGEACDDDNDSAGDGCSAVCTVEPGYACSGEPSVCAFTCGDGVVDAAEGCDDGDLAAGDGCSAACTVEAGYGCAGEPSVCVFTCGDGVIDADEECDDGALSAGDGCSAVCAVESGYSCSGEPSVCDVLCGNGMVDDGEGCDDGDLTAGDGCDGDCGIELGWSCSGEPSLCTALCGDGAVDPGEGCDDGDNIAGDGCGLFCDVEPGYECVGDPSVCTFVCGNGAIESVEECDDGGLLPGDGCDAFCLFEEGWTCVGAAPPTCTPLCGDGILVTGEVCDDGDADLDDACPSGPGGNCEDATCGDGFTFSDGGTESCDDANTLVGDGCHDCALQPDWTCSGEPSACTCVSGYQDNDTDGTCLPSCAYLGWTDCGGNGSCDDLLGVATCLCDASYQDNDNDGTCTPDCTGIVCQNGGSCDDLTGTAACLCPAPYSGTLCELCAVRVDHTNTTTPQDGVSWATAFANLHEALDSIDAGVGTSCEVWVREGTYYAYDGAFGWSFDLPPGAALYGGFLGSEDARADRDWSVNLTLLDGLNPTAGRSNNVLIASGDNVIDGFSILNGGPNGQGAGLDAQNAPNVTVANCRFEMNEADRGGAINARNATMMTITNTVFVDNQAMNDGGAINCEQTTDIAISDSTFYANSADNGGGAIYGRDQCNLSIQDSRFFNNIAGREGGAIDLDCCGATALDASGTIFAANMKDNNGPGTRGGGAIYSDGDPVFLLDTQFIANAIVNGSGDGGAVYVRNAPLLIDRAIFGGNFAPDQGGAIYRENGPDTEYRNVVFTGNDNNSGTGFHLYERDSMELWLTNVTIDNFETGARPIELSNTDAFLTNVIVQESPNRLFDNLTGEMVNVGFSNGRDANEFCNGIDCNIDPVNMVYGSPGFLAAPSGGSFDAAVFDPVAMQTVFTVTGQSWADGELAGLFVRLDGSMPNLFTLPIVANDGDSFRVWGDLTDPLLSHLPVSSGSGSFSFVDYRLDATSICRDAGDTMAPPEDVLGNPRDATPDIGAYEYVP